MRRNVCFWFVAEANGSGRSETLRRKVSGQFYTDEETDFITCLLFSCSPACQTKLRFVSTAASSCLISCSQLSWRKSNPKTFKYCRTGNLKYLVIVCNLSWSDFDDQTSGLLLISWIFEFKIFWCVFLYNFLTYVIITFLFLTLTYQSWLFGYIKVASVDNRSTVLSLSCLPSTLKLIPSFVGLIFFFQISWQRSDDFSKRLSRLLWQLRLPFIFGKDDVTDRFDFVACVGEKI